MLNWKIKNNVISKLYFHGVNIINPWGFETADSSSFFSLEKNIGWRYRILSEKYKYSSKLYSAYIMVEMKEGLWELFIDDKIIGKQIIRKVRANILEDSMFMDFVIRFRFKKDFIKNAEIANNIFYHKNSNIYHQFQEKKVILTSNIGTIKISLIDSIIPSKMAHYVYVCDTSDEWVVHFRLLPIISDKEVIKICTNWAKTRPIPQSLSRLLLKNNKLKDSLWYRPERVPYRNKLVRRFLNISAYGMVELRKSSELMMAVQMDIN